MPLSRSIVDRLETQHLLIPQVIADSSEEKLKRRVIPDKWSAFEQTVHLVAYQPVFLDRVSRMLAGEQPQFGRYRAEDDPYFNKTLGWPLQKLEVQLLEDRRKLVDILENASEEQLQETGTHIRYGRLSLVSWTEFFLLHEAHHLFAIFMLTHEADPVGN